MRRDRLAKELDAVPDFPSPDATREQYRTPANVAAALLWEADADGAIADRDVLDLGCGTGMFCHGAVLLGAASVHGVDLDEDALAVARQQVPDATFELADLADWTPPAADTVLMNPPFGAQRKHADRIFYRRAAEAVRDRDGTVWFLAQPRTEGFLTAYARELGMEVEKVGEWGYPLEARFSFHSESLAGIQVGGYRMSCA